MKFSVICAANKPAILHNNLMASSNIFEQNINVLWGYTNICKAYNDGMKDATEEICLFVHQDVFLPGSFFPSVIQSIQYLEEKKVDWGILGVAGRCGSAYVGNLIDRGCFWGSPLRYPSVTTTLDELLLIMKRDTFQFDEDIPSYHLFGTDICLQAEEAGKTNYAIPAFCHHNSAQDYRIPESFQKSADYIKKKWKHKLPIYTTCADLREE